MFTTLSAIARTIANLYSLSKVVRELWDMINDYIMERRIKEIKQRNAEELTEKEALLISISKAETDEQRLKLVAIYNRIGKLQHDEN